MRYVPSQYKTQQMCDKTILENEGTLKSVHDFYKNQETCNKAVDNFSHALEFVSECYRTQNMFDQTIDTYFLPCFMIPEMCDKAINGCFFVFNSIPDQYKTQEMCDKVVSEAPFLIVYCPDKYITQRICDKAVDDSLASLKLIPDWFVTSKMIIHIFTALHTDENILYFILTKILLISYFLAMKWLFLI